MHFQVWRVLMKLWPLFFMLTLSGCGGGGAGTQASPPIFTGQPLSASVADGESAIFSVVTTGTGPINYQWYRDGMAITGAMASSYQLNSAKISDNGARFHVIASNAQGSATSQSATLTVRIRPITITSQPQSVLADDGSSVTFGVGYVGSEPVTFQWLRNGEPIADAKSSAYTLPAVSLPDDKAQFSVRVANAAGNANSEAATLTVRPVAPTFVISPQTTAAKDGRLVTFSTKVIGSAPLALQWFRDGVPIPGATNDRLQISVTLADSGATFYLSASNRFGTLNSAVAKLTVDPSAPDFAEHPSAASVISGGNLTFSARVTGTGPIDIRWQRSEDGYNWSDIKGATGSLLEIRDVNLRWAKVRVRAVATNRLGDVLSQVADINVVPRLRLMAGSLGAQGFADGSQKSARFGWVPAIAGDTAGNLYVSDGLRISHIRKVTADGEVTTLPLSPVGSFAITALAVDSAGRIYYSRGGDIVRREADGSSSLIAGNFDQWGLADGIGPEARFNYIWALAFDRQGNLIILDRFNCAIRKMTPNAAVTTLAGDPSRCALIDGQGRSAGFQYPSAIAPDANGNILVADGWAIRMVNTLGQVTRWSGSYTVPGLDDGERQYAALYSNIGGLAFDGQGYLYITDAGLIRRIDPTGQVSTMAGSAMMLQPPRDGYGSQATIYSPGPIAASGVANRMLFVEQQFGVVRAVYADGTIRTFAGALPELGIQDGAGGRARFWQPNCTQPGPSGTALLVDDQQRIRQVWPDGTVKTLSHRMPQFTSFECAASDSKGNIFVTGTYNHVIYKIAPDGTTQQFAGQYNVQGSTDGLGTGASFSMPRTIAIDKQDNVYVGESGSHTLRKITPAGAVTTVAGTANDCNYRNGAARSAAFCVIWSLAAGPSGDILISDISGTVRRYSPASDDVTAFAGVQGPPGLSDGSVGRFGGLLSITADRDGYIFVFDEQNSTVRRVSPNGYTVTVIGHRDQHITIPGIDGPINQPRAGLVLENGHLLIVSEYGVLSDY